MTESDPSQFYTGLVAELYDPLARYRATADEYIPFLTRSGTPALELGCGSGRPMLELCARGYEVEGLDASLDMLARCRAAADLRGLQVTLHHALMQSFSLPRRYRSIFLAGNSFTLLDDAAARRALERIHEHLLPGGSALIPLETLDPDAIRGGLGRFTEVREQDGTLLRYATVAVEIDLDARCVRGRGRYERKRPGQSMEVFESESSRCYWDQETFRELLREAGFARVTALDPRGGRAAPSAKSFVFLAQRQQ